MTTRPRDIRLVSKILPITTLVVLAYEIVLTRLFAYMFPNDLTPLAISFAVFGLGAGAYVRARWLGGRRQRVLAVVAHLGMGVSALALYGMLLITHQTVVIIAVSTLPFVCAGAVVSHYYSVRQSERAGETYALDLCGGAAGCVLGVALVAGFGADGALLWLAGISGVAALLASQRTDLAIRGTCVAAAVVCSVLPEALYALRGNWADPLLNRHSTLDKQLPRVLQQRGGAVVDTEWSALGRADLYQTPNDSDKVIFVDATDSTAFLSAGGDLENLFAFLPYADAPVHSALILGSGAGLEVRLAKRAGVGDIDAVELNSAIIRLVRRWQTFGGPVYEQPGVTLFNEEARKFVLTRQRKYDLIQMSLVLTATPQSKTAALAEGYLYTTEAFQSYMDHLEPTGALALIDDSLERTLKNTVTAVATFEHRAGLRGDEAMTHIAVVFNRRESEPGYKYLLLISPTPMTTERLRRFTGEAASRPLSFLWLPGVTSTPAFQSLAAQGADGFARAAPLNMTPPTDDKPYLNNFAKTRAQVVELFRPRLIFSALMFVGLIVVGVTDGRRLGAGAWRSWALAGIYGVSFMFIEMGLLRKLALMIGQPTYVLAVLLFSLLLCCGLGSVVSARVAPWFRGRLGSFAIVAAAVGVATAEALERCYRLEGVSSQSLRIVCALALVAPIGISLGAPFPDLLRRAGGSEDRRLASLWAMNGVGSVLGGALTLILLPLAGGHVLLLTGSALYLVAWMIDR